LFVCLFVLFYIEMGQSDIQGAKLALMCHTAYLKQGIELQVVQAVDGRIEVETTVNSRKEYGRMEMTMRKTTKNNRERQSAD
jgi:hypothetical protein